MRRLASLSGCLALILFALSVSLPAPASPAGVVIVANASVPIGELSFSELRRIFLGERVFWSSNLRITLLMRAPAAPDREVLLKSVYEMSEAQFRQHWIGKVFRAEATGTPQMFYSDEEILGAVASIPGSIAAVDANRIPRGIKIIRIEGHLPGEPGYRLR